jgi:hypothetical protein
VIDEVETDAQRAKRWCDAANDLRRELWKAEAEIVRLRTENARLNLRVCDQETIIASLAGTIRDHRR